MKSHIPNILLLASTASAYWLPETLDNVKTCVVPKKSTPDDTPTVASTVTECGNSSRIVFQKGVTYTLQTPLQLSGLANVEFVFNGNISLPDNITYVETVVNDTSIYPGHWITFAGTNVTLTGSRDPDNGWFIGHGELWFTIFACRLTTQKEFADLEIIQGPAGAANSANNARPHFFSLKVDYLRARDLKVWKPVAWVFSTGGSYVWMTNTLIDAKSTDGFPFNTDGVDMSASNSLIDGFTIYNGDDLINVSPPATNVTVRNMYASGGHGISASCASGTGGNYLFENAVVEDSLFGARFKSRLGTTCQMSNVTWSNFTIHNTTYPIHLIENYEDQETTPTPGANASLAAYLTNFTWQNISGRTGDSLCDGSCITDPCWSATLGESTEKAIYLLCADGDHCKDFHFENIELQGNSGEPAGMECTGLNGSTDMGITCTNGSITSD